MSIMVQKMVLLLLVVLAPFCSVKGAKPTPKTLKILSWNVYLLPNPPFIFGNQNRRCTEIIPVLKNGDWDVVVLQEVFMKKHARKITEGVKTVYPYHYGPIGKKGLFGQNSGVLVLSRIPAECVDSLIFAGDCRGGDCFADKGAIFLEFNKNGERFQVVGTHMQSGDSPMAQAIRTDQYQQICTKLMDPYKQSQIPQFLVGDLNTDQKGMSYGRMLKSFAVKNSADGFPHAYTYDTENNELAISEDQNNPCRQVLDYILFRHNRSGLKVQSYAVRAFRKQVRSKTLELADHFAVESAFLLGSEPLEESESSSPP